MAQNVSFINFVRCNGKLKLTPVALQDGRKFVSMYILTEDDEKIYVNPPKSTDNKVVDAQSGEILVDFNQEPTAIVKQLEANKDRLAVLKGNKNWESPEEEEIPTLTLVAKYPESEVFDVEI